MALSKLSDPGRRRRSFRRHMLFMLQPIGAALAVTMLWYGLWSHGISFAEKDEAILLCIIGGLFIAFTLSAAELLRSVREKSRLMSGYVLRRDQDAFMLLRDEKMPIVMDLFQIVISVVLLIMTALVRYHDGWFGAAAVFSVSLVVAMYFFAIVELQDPTDSPWFAERIPRSWLTADVDTYFKLDQPWRDPNWEPPLHDGR